MLNSWKSVLFFVSDLYFGLFWDVLIIDLRTNPVELLDNFSCILFATCWMEEEVLRVYKLLL
jgi:hypothetical protein